MSRVALLVACWLTLAACATTAPTTVGFELDAFGVMYPVVNGERFLPTEAERRVQIELLLEEYCR